MTPLNFALVVLWTVSVAFCRAEEGPDVEITDKDIVRAVVEVCLPSTSSKTCTFLK